MPFSFSGLKISLSLTESMLSQCQSCLGPWPYWILTECSLAPLSCHRAPTAGATFSEADSFIILKDEVSTTSLAKPQVEKQKTAGEKEKKSFMDEGVTRVGLIGSALKGSGFLFLSPRAILSQKWFPQFPGFCCCSQVVLTIRVLMEFIEMTDCSINHTLVSSIWVRIDWHKWLINFDNTIWVPIICLWFIFLNNSNYILL